MTKFTLFKADGTVVESSSLDVIMRENVANWTDKIVRVGQLDKAVVTGWVDTLYEIAQRQMSSSWVFVISHLEVVYKQFAAGKTLQDAEAYLQQVKEHYQ